MKIERIVLTLFILALILRLPTVYYAHENFVRAEESAAIESHTDRIIETAYQIQLNALTVENSFDKFILSHRPDYARLTSQNDLSLKRSIQRLLDSVKNSSLELKKANEIEELVSGIKKNMPGIDSLSLSGFEKDPKLFRAEQPENLMLNSIIAKANELVTEELQAKTVWRNSVAAARRQSLTNDYYTAIIGLLFIIIVLIFLNRGIRRRKLVETKIRGSEQRLRKMIEDVGDVIYSSDYKGIFTFINTRLESLTGYTTDELIGKHFTFLVDPGWQEKVTEFYKTQFQNKTEETRYEFPIRTKQGQTKWVEQTVVMVGNDKIVEGFQCVVRDITRRKLVENEITRTNQFLDSMLENIPNTIFIKDAKDLTYIRFNKAGEKLMGVTTENVKGKTDEDLFPKEQAEFFTKSDRDMILTGKGIDIPEQPVNTAHGLRLMHTQKILVYDGQGHPLYILGISEDITEKKKAEDTIIELNKNLSRNVAELQESQRFYRTLAHNFPDGTITVLNHDLYYLFVDGRELALEGLTSKELVGTAYLDRFRPEERNEIKNKLSQILMGKEISLEIMLSGNYYILHGAPLRATETSVDEILLVKQNINKLKQAEENVKAALEKEKMINELKSRFVSLASHEFRTPLSTILSSTELIGEYIEHVGQNPALIKDKNIQHLKRIKSAIQNMVNILNNFLSLDQLEQGKTLTNPLEFDIRKFSDEMIDELQSILKSGQKITYTHNSRAVTVYMDRAILGNVTSNLLTNAAKYSPENSVIHFTTNVTGAGLEFTVEDHGIGIPQIEQENLFERFFRAKNTLNIEGTGLGLSIVKKYIDLLNGHISFTSRENEGSIFKVFIASALRPEENESNLIKQKKS
jgi:PAS domain S-box-containing protein